MTVDSAGTTAAVVVQGCTEFGGELEIELENLPEVAYGATEEHQVPLFRSASCSSSRFNAIAVTQPKNSCLKVAESDVVVRSSQVVATLSLRNTCEAPLTSCGARSAPFL